MKQCIAFYSDPTILRLYPTATPDVIIMEDITASDKKEYYWKFIDSSTLHGPFKIIQQAMDNCRDAIHSHFYVLQLLPGKELIARETASEELQVDLINALVKTPKSGTIYAVTIDLWGRMKITRQSKEMS